MSKNNIDFCSGNGVGRWGEDLIKRSFKEICILHKLRYLGKTAVCLCSRKYPVKGRLMTEIPLQTGSKLDMTFYLSFLFFKLLLITHK